MKNFFYLTLALVFIFTNSSLTFASTSIDSKSVTNSEDFIIFDFTEEMRYEIFKDLNDQEIEEICHEFSKSLLFEINSNKSTFSSYRSNNIISLNQIKNLNQISRGIPFEKLNITYKKGDSNYNINKVSLNIKPDLNSRGGDIVPVKAAFWKLIEKPEETDLAKRQGTYKFTLKGYRDHSANESKFSKKPIVKHVSGSNFLGDAVSLIYPSDPTKAITTFSSDQTLIYQYAFFNITRKGHISAKFVERNQGIWGIFDIFF